MAPSLSSAYLVTNSGESFLGENSDGNLAVGLKLLKTFKDATEISVVWIKQDLYSRWRVPEDEPGREAWGQIKGATAPFFVSKPITLLAKDWSAPYA